MDSQYSPQSRVERLLAIGRVILATFSLLAIWLDPSKPAKYVQITYILLAGYVVYALLLALLAWLSDALLVRLRLLTHGVDLMIFSLFTYFTEAPTSPHFFYFVFCLVSATLRWQRRGVLWTAAVALAAVIGIGVYRAEILHDPDFELNRFIIRSVDLTVTAALLVYLRAYEQRLQQAAAAEERIRLARDLHDGPLQSLAGAGLQMETVRRLLDQDLHTAREGLLDLQRQLVAEQRDLRFLIQELKPAPLSSSEADFHLAARLHELGAQIERQWNLSVALRLEPPGAEIPAALTHDLYRIVHEALINAARHAHATAVQVTLRGEDTQVQLTVADNGRGFPFHGHYDFARLTALNLGPVMLKERIAALGGSLTLDSSEDGARLYITLPFRQPEALRWLSALS
ncbi:MAG TPA: sensor histidine kinase [Candidatus Binatia bacterium]|nr:sensor histidine kinase [Candidatus Binatia bacterium]